MNAGHFNILMLYSFTEIEKLIVRFSMFLTAWFEKNRYI